MPTLYSEYSVKRGELYRVAHPSARGPKKFRVFVVVSRNVLIDSNFVKCPASALRFRNERIDR